MNLMHKGNYFFFEYCCSHSFLISIWFLSCKGWVLLFQLNLMRDKIICKDSSDAQIFKVQSYSGRKVHNQYRLVQLIIKSKLAALHMHTRTHKRTSENQCCIYWLFLLLLLLLANSTMIFLSSLTTLLLLLITLPKHLLFGCLFLAVWSSHRINGWPLESRRSEEKHPGTAGPSWQQTAFED